MGMDIDFIAGQNAIKELEKLFISKDHGKRGKMADDIIDFVDKLKQNEKIN